MIKKKETKHKVQPTRATNIKTRNNTTSLPIRSTRANAAKQHPLQSDRTSATKQKPPHLQKARATQEQPSLQTTTATPQATKNKPTNDILQQALNLKLNYLNCGMPQKPEDTYFKKIGCSGKEITPNLLNQFGTTFFRMQKKARYCADENEGVRAG
jgi:hypothetical protein